MDGWTRVRAVQVLLVGLLGLGAHPSFADSPGAPQGARVQALVHMVRQDCGSCHGMRLTGGLGPPLTREALAGFPVESLAATIFNGRPGTPMPPWSAMLNEAEARWIAQQLLQGFPEENTVAKTP